MAIEFVDELEPWEQQRGETQSAYAAFKIYFTSPPPDRQLINIAKLSGSSRKVIYRWAKDNYWADRASAFDQYMNRLEVLELEQARKEMARKHIDIAKESLDRVQRAIDMTRPEDLTPTEVVRWFDIAAKISRAALGEPEKIKEIERTSSGPAIMSGSSSQLDPEQLAQIINVFIESKAEIPGLGIINEALESANQRDPKIIDAEVIEIHSDNADTETDGIPPS